MKKLWLLPIILQIQSCALLTSFGAFELERSAASSFKNRLCYSDNTSYSLCFYEDGSSLLIEAVDPDALGSYLQKINYKIWGKFKDEFFHWGVYQVRQDTIELEFLEKTDQWGFMGMRRWEAVMHNDSATLSILPGPVNDKPKELSYYSLPAQGVVLQRAPGLDTLNIQPQKAWINK